MKERSESSQGVTVTKREVLETEDAVVPILPYNPIPADHTQGMDRVPSTEHRDRSRDLRMEEFFRSPTYRCMPSSSRHSRNQERSHEEYRSGPSRALRNLRPMRHGTETISMMSSSTSNGGTCITPHGSSTRDDYYTHKPLRSFTNRTNNSHEAWHGEVALSRHSSVDRYERRSDTCFCNDCRSGSSKVHRTSRSYDPSKYFTRQESSLSRGGQTEEGSIVNPYSRQTPDREHDRGRYYRGRSVDAADEAEAYVRDRYEHSEPLQHAWTGSSIDTQKGAAHRYRATPNNLYADLRAALRER